MTLRIPRSLVQSEEDFAAAVKQFASALVAHGFTVNKSRPTADHPLIEQAVKRVTTPKQPDKFVPDYEIYDDDPPAV
jgi:hypothetical protein